MHKSAHRITAVESYLLLKHSYFIFSRHCIYLLHSVNINKNVRLFMKLFSDKEIIFLHTFMYKWLFWIIYIRIYILLLVLLGSYKYVLLVVLEPQSHVYIRHSRIVCHVQRDWNNRVINVLVSYKLFILSLILLWRAFSP